MLPKHKASEIVHIDDLEKDDEDEETFNFWYYDPTAEKIDVTAPDIAKLKRIFKSKSNNWSIYVEYDMNDVGVARFYLGQYDAAVDAYVAHLEGLADDDCDALADADFNIYEALAAKAKAEPTALEACISRYQKIFSSSEGEYLDALGRVGQKMDAEKESTTVEKEIEENTIRADVPAEKIVRVDAASANVKETHTLASKIAARADVPPLAGSNASEIKVPTKHRLDARGKEIRFLRKKLREIAALETRSKLNTDQISKVKRKGLYAKRLRDIAPGE